jgi:hypothetical protein
MTGMSIITTTIIPMVHGGHDHVHGHDGRNHDNDHSGDDHEKEMLFMLLQLAGGTFPTGGFSQSWGLETYVFNGQVTGEESFRRFLGASIDTTLCGLEGPTLCRAYDLTAQGDMDGLKELDKKITAMKLTRESRRLLRMARPAAERAK